jgi:hypothetical protein
MAPFWNDRSIQSVEGINAPSGKSEEVSLTILPIALENGVTSVLELDREAFGIDDDL